MYDVCTCMMKDSEFRSISFVLTLVVQKNRNLENKSSPDRRMFADYHKRTFL